MSVFEFGLNRAISRCVATMIVAWAPSLRVVAETRPSADQRFATTENAEVPDFQQHVVPLLSDPLGHGADYFGTADLRPGALVSESTLWMWQVGLILVGHVVGILVAHRVGHRMHPDRSQALKSLTPVFVAMVVVSIAGLGLMHLDMNMRLGRM